MAAWKWLISDVISELEEKQYRICTWIKNIEPNCEERESLIEAVQHLENTLNSLEKIIKLSEK